MSFLQDPQAKLRESCQAKKECCELMGKLNSCNERVRSKTKTAETCVEEMIDWMHCVDHCVSKLLIEQWEIIHSIN